jgi:hypothetical protein
LQKCIRSPLSVDDIKTIEQFSYAVELRNAESLKPISHALLAALGKLNDPSVLFSDQWEINALINICRTIPKPANEHNVVWLQPVQVIKLEDILDRIGLYELDITLLGTFFF